ncbi:ABC transporter permease [Clostridium botulinum]|nr:ABC transporter permease [Clostridium botulinum]NFO91416.1 ABC transporter permease [Clostridium botulinum]
MVILIKSRKLIKELILDIYTSKHLILNLSKNDFKTRFSGSYLGITWAFVQPIVVVIIYWFVFQVGFKSAPMNDFPFILWLIAGMVPWFFFNESLLNSTNSFLEYSYLVKKVVFKISILPVVKLMSAFYVHLFFIFFATIVYMLYGYMPQIYIIQSLYYSFCVFMLALGISYMTSSIVIFFKDLGQIVSILLQFGMWMTPIMYSEEMMPNSIRWILKLNPMYYIVEGYRDTFIRHVWFWERYNKTIYFWGLTVLIFTIGAIIFKKLKPHFSDVL